MHGVGPKGQECSRLPHALSLLSRLPRGQRATSGNAARQCCCAEVTTTSQLGV
jgi:hypothetical protein